MRKVKAEGELGGRGPGKGEKRGKLGCEDKNKELERLEGVKNIEM